MDRSRERVATWRIVRRPRATSPPFCSANAGGIRQRARRAASSCGCDRSTGRYGGGSPSVATSFATSTSRSPRESGWSTRASALLLVVPVPALAQVLPAGYTPGRPEDTPLYTIVRDNLDDFLEHVDAEYTARLPKYVVDEFRQYLACGQLEGGFIRCHCDGCGHDVLVAFACKRRGICPSCCARRMCNEAAHLTDRVIPNVPIRQWVLSLPFPLRRLAAFRADVLTALSAIFVEEIFRATGARKRGANTEGGAVTFVQRFGGSLNLNVHFHVVVLDGAFERTSEGIRFRERPPPPQDAIERVAQRVHDRALRWLQRKGLLDERAAEDRSNEIQESALDACARVALFGGGLTDADDTRDPDHSRGPFDAKAPKRFSARYEGFDVHAAVRIEANDDEGRERLFRYCARPAFALDRLSVTRDGNIAYRVKYPSGKRTHRLMTPVEFMARLAALIPPPFYPLVRYHGALAPHSKWRKHVVPTASEEQRAQLAVREAKKATAARQCKAHREPRRGDPPNTGGSTTPRGAVPVSAKDVATRAAPADVAISPVVELTAHNMITVRHWGRVLDGDVFAISPRIPWAELLRRTYGIDTLVCPACDGRLRVLAAITKPETAAAILRALRVTAPKPPHPKPPDKRTPFPAPLGRSAQLALPFVGG